MRIRKRCVVCVGLNRSESVKAIDMLGLDANTIRVEVDTLDLMKLDFCTDDLIDKSIECDVELYLYDYDDERGLFDEA